MSAVCISSHDFAVTARPPRLRPVLSTLAVMLGCAFLFGGQPAGEGIRGDLVESAALVGSLPATASGEAVREALKTAFVGRSISIDTAKFPTSVSVTVHRMTREGCDAAVKSARRLEGDVVVELAGYRSPGDCAASNDMTWRIMP
jgi:hypothetical protein